jgi:hypothetical protein
MIEIDQAAIDADVRRSFDAINLKRAEAETQIWQAFLYHAGRPLSWCTHFDPNRENDLLYLFAASGSEALNVTIQRRVGLVRDGDYEGTIQSEIRVTVSDVDQAEDVNLEQYGERLDDFRRTFEATDAFKALTTGRITRARHLPSIAEESDRTSEIVPLVDESERPRRGIRVLPSACGMS